MSSQSCYQKNIKYIDKTTLKAFEYLCGASGAEEKKALANFKDNVRKMNTRLRRKLGYIETDILSEYRFSSPFVKNLYRISIEIAIAYLLVVAFVVAGILGNDELIIYIALPICISVLVLCVELIEMVVRIAVSKTCNEKSKIENKRGRK